MNAFDLTITTGLHGLAGSYFLLDWFMIFWASWWPYLAAALFAVLIVRMRKRKSQLFVVAWTALAAIVSRGIITETIRFIWHRDRPFVALGFDPLIAHDLEGSFPSGHMAFFGVLILPAFFMGRKWGWLYASTVVLMGIARVYAGVHWATDIIGGLLVGMGVSYGMRYILERNMDRAGAER